MVLRIPGTTVGVELLGLEPIGGNAYRLGTILEGPCSCFFLRLIYLARKGFPFKKSSLQKPPLSLPKQKS